MRGKNTLGTLLFQLYSRVTVGPTQIHVHILHIPGDL